MKIVDRVSVAVYDFKLTSPGIDYESVDSTQELGVLSYMSKN